MTLNKSKCEFKKESITFLGHVIDASGISQDPDKTAAVPKMSQPTTVTELRRFLRMVNQLSRFTPHVAELSQPLRELLSNKRSWFWGPAQQEAFTRVKEELTKPSVLAIYDPEAQTRVIAQMHPCMVLELYSCRNPLVTLEASLICLESHDRDRVSVRSN